LSGDFKNGEVIIYTDGGCHGNPGPGGWAWRAVTADNVVVAENSGYDPATTNNRMELSAVIEALRWAREQGTTGAVEVKTDSQYVRQGITDWIVRWRKNGWITSTKKPVKNAELWRTLDEINGLVRPTWSWVRGHAGDEHNEACDQAVQLVILNSSRS
jgi:ribonuclease HI